MAGHFPYRFRPCQEEMVSFIRNSVLLGRCAVIESGTGTGKTSTSLAGCLDAVGGTGRKVVFLTRTKSQHRQVAVECRAISENRKVISVSVQGRSPATCPMIAGSAELSDGTPEELSRLCSEVKKGNSGAGKCRFFEQITDSAVERCLSYIRSNGPDPEDFREFCTALGVCPYEMTKRILPYADVVSASYIFVFDPQIRSRFMSWLGITEKETVLIVDEAHNLPDFLREGRTRRITDRALDLCLKEAKDYGNPDVGGGVRAADVVLAVKGILAEAVGEYLEDREDALLPSTFMVEGLMLRLSSGTYALHGMIAGLLDAGARVADEKSSRRKLPRSHMTVLGRFLQAWMETDGTYIHLVVGGDNPCLEAYCMDIRDTALPLRTCRASVSMSGTLEPIKYYCRDLGLDDADTRVFPSPFDPANRRTVYVSDVSTKYEEMSKDPSLFPRIRGYILDIVNCVRVNTAVFFPSYSMMHRILETGIEGEMGRRLFLEDQDMDGGELMANITLFRSTPGQVLFCVCGGRVSEGLDFPGKEMELAVVVGIPYAKPSARQKALLDYYLARSGESWGPVVKAPAVRKIRQSVGRLIRSEHDRGIAVILDRRAGTLEGLDAERSEDPVGDVRRFFGYGTDRWGRRPASGPADARVYLSRGYQPQQVTNMQIEVRYGKDGSQKAEVPDANYIGTYFPNEVVCGDPSAEVKRSLASPIGSEPLGRFLEGGKDIVFIVNDGTRPTPTSLVLDALADTMDLRVPRYLIATGAHRAPTEEEYRNIFGKHLETVRDRIVVHDAKESECVNLGTSKNGTPMEVNRVAVDADRLVIITSVEPHYFAGWTGGRKSFLPGVASYRTIEANHKMAVGMDAQALALQGNPVHEDMMDALAVVKGKRIFSIQMVLDRHHGIYKVASGELNAAFAQAVKYGEEVFIVPVPEKADVVISAAPYPMDVDLYQSQKALDNGKWALKKGGTIIMVSKCREGTGSDNFLKQLSSSKDPEQVIENIRREYRLGYHKAAKMAEIQTWAKVQCVTDLDPGLISGANMIPYRTLDEAVSDALEQNPRARVMVLAEGSVTIPRPPEGSQ